MTEKQSNVLTFHQVRARCESPDAEAWKAFVDWYSPLFLKLLDIYAGGDSAAWGRTVAALAKTDFARLRAMERKSERGFLVELRATVLDEVLDEVPNATGVPAGNKTSGSAADGPVLDTERVASLMEGLPLLHQEMLWFKLAGYTDATIEAILRMSPSVARAAMERLRPDFAAALEIAADRCLWPRKVLELQHQARAAKKEDCPPIYQMMRIHDGQVTWYDKEPVEKKIAGCLHCLESWASLHEVSYWRRPAPAVAPELLQKFLAEIPMAQRAKKPLFQRLFGSSKNGAARS